MIFIFTGSSYKNKKIIQKRFLKFIRSDRRNWRRTVFLVDEKSIDTTTEDINERLHTIVNFIHNNENDILISLPIDLSDFISKVKSEYKDEEYSITHFIEDKMSDKDESCIYVNVTKYSVDNQYSKFIQKVERFF